MTRGVYAEDMFGKKKTRDGYDEEKDLREGRFVAAEQTNLPLNDFMTRLLAQELPLLDSRERTEVYRLLRQYSASGGKVITNQDELPAGIREILDL
ncbi:hypothetical protein B840_00790 [Corynebacterium marinum DSM 44953]|uniref:Uncharacterized protein n=2 Tax=Corynebacterium marinum TaxID=349751 RepID=A0A0B6TIM5_9CORY|nr:hypothetical protein B840_00790 [Corynebacterium marinum DSM 44953]